MSRKSHFRSTGYKSQAAQEFQLQHQRFVMSPSEPHLMLKEAGSKTDISRRDAVSSNMEYSTTKSTSATHSLAWDARLGIDNCDITGLTTSPLLPCCPVLSTVSNLSTGVKLVQSYLPTHKLPSLSMASRVVLIWPTPSIGRPLLGQLPSSLSVTFPFCVSLYNLCS